MINKVKDLLDIYIITYNRASKLEETLKQIFSEKSPIREFDINIIDNNSTDDTALVINNYQKKYSNLKYIKNKYNIGGNANIVKAFYKASKDYVWILADNDNYCWDSWSEVEDSINKKFDAIIVATYECPKFDIAQLFLQTTFLPGVIYRTSNIDDTVIGNMEFNISNMFPHLALSAKLINEQKAFHILNKPIVLIGSNNDEKGNYTYTRGYTGFIHPLQKGMNWISGYANSLYLIKNSKIRNYIITHNRYCTGLTSAKLFFYKDKASDNNLFNLFCVFCVLSPLDKFRFLINFILYLTLYKIIFISRQDIFKFEENKHIIKYNLRLFTFIKTKLFVITKNIKGVL